MSYSDDCIFVVVSAVHTVRPEGRWYVVNDTGIRYNQENGRCSSLCEYWEDGDHCRKYNKSVKRNRLKQCKVDHGES